MMIRRRLATMVMAGLLLVGLSTPTFASGTLVHKFTDLNAVDVMDTTAVMDYNMATAIGETDSIGGIKTFVSAVRKTDGNLRLNAYYINTTTNAKLGADADDGGAIDDVAVAAVGTSGLVVAAVQLPNDTVKFIAYDVSTGTNGRTIQRLNDFVPTNFPALSNVTNLQISGIGPLLGGKFVTIVRKQDGAMRIDSWQAVRTNNTVAFTPLSMVDGAFPVGNIAMIRNTTFEGHFVTLHQDSNDIMNVRVWRVDHQNASAAITLVASRIQGSAIEGFDVAFSSGRILTARYTTNGVTAVELWNFDQTPAQITLEASGAGPGATRGLQIFDMGGGPVLAQHGVGDYFYQHTMTKIGSSITLDAGGFNSNQIINGMSGVDGGDGQLFYAIADGNGGDLSHQLWLHQ